MPRENPNTILFADYYIDERNQWCEPCAIRLTDLETVAELEPLPQSYQGQYCTECAAFAAGYHPDRLKGDK